MAQTIANVARRPRFLFLDGVTALPVVFVLARPSYSTFGIALCFSLIMYLIERRGMPLPVFFRRVRCFMIGRRRYIRPPWRHTD